MLHTKQRRSERQKSDMTLIDLDQDQSSEGHMKQKKEF